MFEPIFTLHRESNGSYLGQYHIYSEQSEQYKFKKRGVLVHRAWFMKAITLTAGNVGVKAEEALSKDDHF